MPFPDDASYNGRLSSVDPKFLTIRETIWSDEGRYRCVAINGTVQAKDTIDISIITRANRPVIPIAANGRPTSPKQPPFGTQDEDDVPVPISFHIRTNGQTKAMVSWVMPRPEEITHYTVLYWPTIKRFSSGRKVS